MQMRHLALALSSLLLLALGCGYDNRGLKRVDYEEVEVVKDTIDTDQIIDDLGEGVGLFVEYESGGLWRVLFACDTAITDEPCVWTVYAQTVDESSILGSQGLEFEASDYLSSSTAGFVEMQSITELDLDMVEFRVAEGTAMAFEIWLSGDDSPERYVYWISEGGLNLGMPSPVFQLSPTQP